jgi:hypothetical protein
MRKNREDQVTVRANFLEVGFLYLNNFTGYSYFNLSVFYFVIWQKENSVLRAQVSTLRDEAFALKQMLLHKNASAILRSQAATSWAYVVERTNKNFVHVIVFTFIFTNANPSCLTDFSFGFNPSRLLFIISFLDVLVCYQPTKLHSAKNKRNRNQFLFCRQSFNHDHPTLIFFKYYTVTHMLNTLNKVLGEDIFYQETPRISPKWKRRMFF